MKKSKTEFQIPVVGISYRLSVSSRRMLAAHVEEETVECILERDPENLHDKNAIKVVIINSPYERFHLGFVPREVARHLAPLLDDPSTELLAAVLLEMNAQEATAMLHVTLKTAIRAKKKKSA